MTIAAIDQVTSPPGYGQPTRVQVSENASEAKATDEGADHRVNRVESPDAVAFQKPQDMDTPKTSQAAFLSGQSEEKQAENERNAQTADLHNAMSRANEQLHNLRHKALRFSVDEDTEQTIVKVIDVANDEVIRQLPPEAMLEIAKRIDNLTGMVLEEQA